MKYLFLIAMTIFLVNCKSPKASSSASSDKPEPVTKVKVNEENFIENNPKMLISKKYQVILLKDGDALYAFPKKKPIVTFGEEGQLSTKLSANRCGGRYEAGKKKISFSADACTEMCCDSKEDMAFQSLLSNTFSYRMTTTHLILTNDNTEIKLQLVD